MPSAAVICALTRAIRMRIATNLTRNFITGLSPNARTQPQPPGKHNAEHRETELSANLRNGSAVGCWLE
jgi:hypothetical protein